MVELTGLRVDFEGFALGPMNLRIDGGERVALVGANGAGKSTLLRLLAGREAQYRGQARIQGKEVRDNLVWTRRQVGLLPETLLGLPWMSCREHLDLMRRFYSTWDAPYATMLAHEVGVPLGKPLARLSKGNRAKLAFVSAEAFRPPLLLLDEPTSGVDPLMRETLLQLVGQCVPRCGRRAVVYSSHVLEDLERIADRVLLLREGCLDGDWSVDPLRSDVARNSLAASVLRRLSRA